MDDAQRIRAAMESVATLRQRSAARAPLGAAVGLVKRLQALRFENTYADLLRGGSFEVAARFFLHELYGDRDYSERDAQFSRIAGALQTLFPQQVLATAVLLADLHALTEQLDHAMGEAWLTHANAPDDAARYLRAWREVGARAQREQQLGMVLEMGTDLARLTRTPGLRLMLKMMRKPAQAAGLASLQAFLESGFDTFGEMAHAPGHVALFLELIRERESALIGQLFESPPVTCETELRRTLGQAR